MTAKVSPFGTWESPLAASDLVEGSLGLGYPTQTGSGGGTRPRIVWQEARPAEGGRVALVAWDGPEEGCRELLPPEMSARSTVHEYGGRAWAIGGPGGRALVTSNFSDQRLWDISPGKPPRPLSGEPDGQHAVRFACPVLSPDGRWVIAVRERHVDGEVSNDLVAIARFGEPAEPSILAEGHAFYSSPELSSDGELLAFICWDHPDMPWDRTQLWRGRFSEGILTDLRGVAGQDGAESVLQPKWAPDGSLAYISDRTGWWNLYIDDRAMAPMEAEFAGPAWAFGDSDYAFLPDGTVFAAWKRGGAGYLGVVDGDGVHPLDLPYTYFAHLCPASLGGEGGVLAIAGGPARSPEIVRVNVAEQVEVLQRSRPDVLGEEWISMGEAFDFPTGDRELAHAIYYPPRNPRYVAPEEELPPLIVSSHGGPTASASRVLDLRTQFWTTRGFGVVDVDYRGSTGYGRSYRGALEGRWGLADVEDCAAAAQSLADSGRVSPDRMVIRGGSSSGLTAMAALARHKTFVGAVVLFGVADLTSLNATTHKFESRYIGRLVPEAELAARSPLELVGSIKVPVLFVHGLDDKVVPPDQSRRMVSALRLNGVRALLVEIEGESHGFRKATSLVRSLEAELAFYGSIFGFSPGGDLSRAKVDLADAEAPTGATWR
ncbi:MAG TPA: prolyl oligopeptidase family serine peptidase [Acidimicrobiales bacterium]|nr:prolyl oligopeptidase family serine peptidase [Acidimicrobiales bacterium]